MPMRHQGFPDGKIGGSLTTRAAPQNGLQFFKLSPNRAGCVPSQLADTGAPRAPAERLAAQEGIGMTLWLVLTMMISAATVFLSIPLLRRLDPQQAPTRDAEAYCDQLTEIARKAAAGLIDSSQAESACADIKRALVSERVPAAGRAGFSRDRASLAAFAVAGILMLGAAVLYALNGSSDLPSGSDKAAFSRAEFSAVDQLAAAMQGATSLPQNPSQPRQDSVDAMIARLADRLKRSPDDPEGWRMLGWSYFNTERFAQAASAYAKAIELNPQSADYRSSRGEALVRAADGRVTDTAKAAFAEALRLDPTDPRARFFLGLAKEQAGDKQAALDDWIALLNQTNSNDPDANDPWVGDLRQRITELGQETGVDVSQRLSRARAAPNAGLLGMLQQQEQAPAIPDVAVPNAAAASAVPSRGDPTADDVRNAQAMQPADRMAMIQAMVDRLASRLDQSPRDVDAWIRLMRSRQVLGEADAAEQAFRFALDVFKDSPQEREQISAAARELGLSK
jgi:cytochrome c-type biogenesis protein CcmH